MVRERERETIYTRSMLYKLSHTYRYARAHTRPRALFRAHPHAIGAHALSSRAHPSYRPLPLSRRSGRALATLSPPFMIRFTKSLSSSLSSFFFVFFFSFRLVFVVRSFPRCLRAFVIWRPPRRWAVDSRIKKKKKSRWERKSRRRNTD